MANFSKAMVGNPSRWLKNGLETETQPPATLVQEVISLYGCKIKFQGCKSSMFHTRYQWTAIMFLAKHITLSKNQKKIKAESWEIWRNPHGKSWGENLSCPLFSYTFTNSKCTEMQMTYPSRKEGKICCFLWAKNIGQYQRIDMRFIELCCLSSDGCKFFPSKQAERNKTGVLQCLMLSAGFSCGFNTSSQKWGGNG